MWWSIVCCVELQDNFIHSKMYFWRTLLIIITINGDILPVPYSLWQFRAESVLEKVYHIGVHIVHSNSTFIRNIWNYWCGKVLFKAFSQLFLFKNACLNNIGAYYLLQFRPETFSSIIFRFGFSTWRLLRAVPSILTETKASLATN